MCNEELQKFIVDEINAKSKSNANKQEKETGSSSCTALRVTAEKKR